MPHHSADHPAAIYRDSLSRGSYWAVHHSLETIVKLLGASDPWSYPWHRLRYRDTARVRAQLVERYAPATVNKILSALRGVLKTCWRLGLMNAETYARAADVANVRATTLPSGRAVERDEVRALFATCDDSPAGRRDAAMLAILYGGGLRRAEVCGLDLADFDAGGCVLPEEGIVPSDLAGGLAADLACALDPAELASRVGLPPDPWQAEFLRSDEPRVLLNCSRQAGKSTVTALLGVHAALYEPGALVLLLSPDPSPRPDRRATDPPEAAQPAVRRRKRKAA